MPAIESDGGHVRLRLDVAYDGTDFAGWATQTNQRTVAGAIDDALSTVFRAPVVTRAAGRTDTGVHATGQVAHVRRPGRRASRTPTRAPRDGTSRSSCPLVRRLARLLPEDVRVLDVVRAPRGFDARFSALRRHYEYRLSTAPFGVEPQEARFVTPWPRPLDVEAMSAASRELLGLTTSPRSAVRARGRPRSATCSGWTGCATVTRSPHTSPPTRSAGRWCGRWSARCWPWGRAVANPRWCAELLTSTRRSSDFAAAPARGLTLVGVDYPPDDELEARIKVTRDVRTADEVRRVER